MMMMMTTTIGRRRPPPRRHGHCTVSSLFIVMVVLVTGVPRDGGATTATATRASAASFPPFRTGSLGPPSVVVVGVGGGAGSIRKVPQQRARDEDDDDDSAPRVHHHHDHPKRHILSLLLQNHLRGGGIDATTTTTTMTDDDDDDDGDDGSSPPSTAPSPATTTTTTTTTASSLPPVTVTIRTSIGHDLIDASVELHNVQRHRTIASMKESVRRQLYAVGTTSGAPKPPASSLRLVFDGRVLPDDVTVQDLLDDDDDDDDGGGTGLTMILDTVPPVDAGYVRDVEDRLPGMTTSEVLRAYAANEALSWHNAASLERDHHHHRDIDDDDDDDDDVDDDDGSLLLYVRLRQEAERIQRDMERVLVRSETARRVLHDDRTPSDKAAAGGGIEIRGHRVRRTGGGGGGGGGGAGRTAALRERVQRNMNISWSDTVRYCVLFVFFGYFGGRTPTARAILLLGAPSVFLVQARPVKLWLKQFLYALLDHPPGIVLSLLPAPQQAILNLDYDVSMGLLYGTHHHTDVRIRNNDDPTVLSEREEGGDDEEEEEEEEETFFDAMESDDEEDSDQDDSDDEE